MAEHSRRVFVGLMAAGVAGSLAGCLGDDDDDGTGEGQRSERLDWIPTEVVPDEPPYVFMDLDLSTIIGTWPEEFGEDLQIDELADDLDTDVEAFEGFVAVEAGPFEQHTAFLGSFDADTIIEANPEVDADDLDTYEGYYDTGDGLLIGDDALIVSPTAPRAFVDAQASSADRAVDDVEYFAEAADAIGNQPFSMFTANPDEEAEDGQFMVMGAELATGDSLSFVIRVYFEDEASAQEQYDEGEEELLDQMEEGEIDDARVDGNVIIIEGIVDAEELL